MDTRQHMSDITFAMQKHETSNYYLAFLGINCDIYLIFEPIDFFLIKVHYSVVGKSILSLFFCVTSSQSHRRREYIFPPGAVKMRFIHQGLCAKDRVLGGTKPVAENRGE